MILLVGFSGYSEACYMMRFNEYSWRDIILYLTIRMTITNIGNIQSVHVN